VMDNFKRTVFAWGYGDSMANALQGVATLFGAEEGAFFGVAKVAALLGFIATLLAYFSARAMADPLRIVKFYVVFIGVVSLFFGFRVPVQVQDKALNQTYVVQNVPYPVAYVLAFITQIEDAIAKQVDRAFRLEGHYCGSQKMGIFACSQIMAQAMDMRVVDPYLYFNLTNFFQDCVFTNILDGTLNAHQLETSDHLYSLIFNHSYLHPARFTVLYDGRRPCTYPCNEPCGGGCSMSCVDAGAYLSSALSRWVNYHGFKALSATVGQTVLMDLLNMVPTQIMHLSQMGTGFLMQAVLMNQFKETYRSWAASYGMGLTEQGIFTKGQIERATANRYLPLINGILHVLFASLVPVLVVFMLTPLMKGALMFTFIFGLWMIVWKFTEAVVNGFFYSKLYGNFYNFAQQGRWDFNLLNAPVISALLVDHISLASSLYWLIPTVSFVVASLGGYAFHSFATGLGGVVQSTAQASAGDVARGNFNAGQVNYRNVSAGNTSFGSFVFGTTSAFTNSVLQESNRNIKKEGRRIQVTAGQPNYVRTLAKMIGDSYTIKVVEAVLGIVGDDEKTNIDIAISPHGRVEYIVASGGSNGIRVEYRGGGNLVVYSRGVEHGNIMLNQKGEIEEPGSITNVGNIVLEYIKARQKQAKERAGIYRQVADLIRNFHNIEDETKRRTAFIRAFENLLRHDYKTFRELIEEFGLGKVFEDLVKQAVLTHNTTERTKTLGAGFELGFKFGATNEPKLKNLIKFIPGPDGKIYVYGKYEGQWKKVTTLSQEQASNMISRLYEDFKERYRTREGTTKSSGTRTSRENAVETSKSFASGKAAEVSQMLLRKADELLEFANSLSVNMRDNPLNDFYKQKFKEGLELFEGNAAKAVRYAHEELVKLINNKKDLERYIREYAEKKGLKDLWWKEQELLDVLEQVPSEQRIKDEQQRVIDEVRRQQGGSGERTESRKPENPPKNSRNKQNPPGGKPNEKLADYRQVLAFLKYKHVLDFLNGYTNNNGGQGNPPGGFYRFNSPGGGGQGNPPGGFYRFNSRS